MATPSGTGVAELGSVPHREPFPAVDVSKRPHERYTHEHVVALLREGDAVIPATPPVYAVHTLYNREAVIPPMCYTRTEGQYNPCYVCHQDQVEGRPNRMDDGDLQLEYSFSEVAATNRWTNLFVDRGDRVAQISDDEISDWVARDNYSELAPRLRAAGFEGYVPDLDGLERGAGAFDSEGFAKDGSHWVAFNYKPLPSTFWPTNGSTDDVMIRLARRFRTTEAGAHSRDVYRANLALLEATMKDVQWVSVRPTNEEIVAADLDGDGELGRVTRVRRAKHYVGAAKRFLVQPFLYPQGTEFLHTVRYVGVDADGAIYAPPRMKEVRYMRKRWGVSKEQLYERYVQEHDHKQIGQLPGYVDRGVHGFDNEMGWVVSGFIEDANGRLRVNAFEENFSCMGCHTSLGTTIDSTFSFPRKVDGAAGWGYLNLRGMPDVPSLGESRGEIATYLERAGGGGEFRSNPEMEQRWFSSGRPDPDKLARARDVYDLITPSRERALAMNKAYRTIVEDQTFIYGRDATVRAPVNVYREVNARTAPTLPRERTFRWDIRLDWASAQ